MKLLAPAYRQAGKGRACGALTDQTEEKQWQIE